MSSKYWTDKTNGKDNADVSELNTAFDTIASDIEDIKENSGSGGLASKSVFYSLKFLSQNQNDDGSWTYVFDNSENKLNFADSDTDKYEQGGRDYQLIVNNNETFYRIILSDVTENESTVEATVSAEWHIDLSALADVIPDKEHYIILKNNIGVPYGNYAISSDEKTLNSSVEGVAYGDGATATGLGTSALAHSTFASGEGNVATRRRASAIGGEGNASFGYGSTALGVYNTVYSTSALATGTYGIAVNDKSANLGFAQGYYNIYNENGELKSVDEIYEDFQDDDTRNKMSIAYGDTSLVGGAKNVAGAAGSVVFGNQNFSTKEATWSLTLGGKNINRVPNSLVLGTGTDNTDSLINVSNRFKVNPGGDVTANYIYGVGNNINVYQEVSSEKYSYLPVSDFAFSSYSSSEISANTSQGNIGIAKVIDYTDNSTYWHSAYSVKDGVPYPDPALSSDFQYTITIASPFDVPRSNIDSSNYMPTVIRYYPRQEKGNLDTNTWWKKVKIRTTIGSAVGDTTVEQTFSISRADFKSDAYGYYYDYVLSTGATFPATYNQVSKIEIIIYETANATSDYPYGTYACAQGIRIGYVDAVKLPEKPIEYDGRLGTMTVLTNTLKDGAYYSADDVKSIVDAILDTKKSFSSSTSLAFVAGNENSGYLAEIDLNPDGSSGNINVSARNVVLKDAANNSVNLYDYGSLSDMSDLLVKYDTDTVLGVIKALSNSEGIKGITVGDYNLKVTSPAGNGLVFETTDVTLTNGYQLFTLGQSVPSSSSNNLMSDIDNLYTKISALNERLTALEAKQNAEEA